MFTHRVRIVRAGLFCLLLVLAGCSDSADEGGDTNVEAFPTVGGNGETDTSGGEPASVACTTDSDCAGTLSHPCLEAQCNTEAGQCFQGPVIDGTPCESGNACVKTEICMAGQCTGGQPLSCDDQEPCTDDSCDPSLGCVHVTNSTCCEPLCTGKECGSDGCGGACGVCQEGESCVNSVCVTGGCNPQCTGKVCGDDGCGGSCGACGATETCTNGQCVGEGPCTPLCGTKECGADGCGGLCGTCPVGASCSGQGQCVQCTPNCFGKECGDDGCGGFCGTCPIGVPCDIWGSCDFCEPDCAGKSCGDDGCGGTCGTCGGLKTCDGSGVCVDLSEGSTCADPFVVTALPFVVQADTTGYTNSYSFDNDTCPGETWGQGLASPDHAYLFPATANGNYLFKLEVDSGFWGAMYIVSSCADINGSCLGAGTTLGQFSPVEQLHYLSAGDLLYVIVDGYDSNWVGSAEQGSYTLTIEGDAGCSENCGDQECGDDGCGGLCGVCGGGTVCSPMFTCVDPGEGSTCSQPFHIDSLPYWVEATTEGATNDYFFEDSVCPGESNGQGAASPDHAYTFTAPSSGNYLFKLEAESLYWASLYLVSNCGDIDGSCGGGGKTSSQWTPIEVIHYMNAGEQVFAIVDGYDNNNVGWSAEEGGYTLTVEANAGCPENCGGQECGDDGCGGLCGSCVGGQVCSPMFTCVDPGEGSTCNQPFDIDTLPYWIQSSTEGATNDYFFDDDVCPGENSGQGSESPDQVYAFTPTSSGNYLFKLEVESPFWGSLYVVDDCGDVDGTCSQGGKTSSQFVPVELIRYLEAWEDVFVIVDGYDNNGWNAEAGPYTLTVEDNAGCPDNCTGLECGDDGCGGLCGVCAAFEVCTAEFLCELPQDGESCSNPATVGALPYTTTGDTSTAANAHWIDSGVCPGLNVDTGTLSPDQVYEFSAPKAGEYRIHVDPTGSDWLAIYVVEACSDLPATACVVGDDDWEPEVTVSLGKNETIRIVVDGYGASGMHAGPYTLTVQEKP